MDNIQKNRRTAVDEIVRDLTKGKKMEISNVTASLMENFRVLEKNSENERDALKSVVAANVLLSKTVGLMAIEMKAMQERINRLENKK